MQNGIRFGINNAIIGLGDLKIIKRYSVITKMVKVGIAIRVL